MDRLDELIEDIITRFHKPAMSAGSDDAPCADVLLVAHGHILRAFAMRWIGRQLTDGVSLLLEGEFASSLRRKIYGEEERSRTMLKTEWMKAFLANTRSAGGVGTLSYEHHRLEEPAIL